MIAKTRKIKRSKEKVRTNGNYRVIGDNVWGVTVINEGSPELFNKVYNRDLERRARALFYMDKDKIETNNFEISLACAFARHGNQYFQTRLVTRQEPDAAEYAEYADVVINGFESSDSAFLEALDRYDDGSRLFLNIPKIWEGLGGYANERTVADYVRGLREDLQNSQGDYRVGSLEGAVV